MTIMSHAEIFSSLLGSFIVIYKLFARQPISNIEIIATIIAFTGAVIISCDSSARKMDPIYENILLGNIICFVSSIFGAINLEYSQLLLNKISLFHILFF